MEGPFRAKTSERRTVREDSEIASKKLVYELVAKAGHEKEVLRGRALGKEC